ncbi:MAG: hypothetical protein EOP11_22290, partial [Proteobacteria bacterium]
IAEVSPARPELNPGQTLETSATIFPGFIDLNAELSHGGSPLSALPRAQFRNRAEWYYRPTKFYEAESSLPGIAGPSQACAAVRWGEIRALTGGTAVARGLDKDSLSCALNFGVSNLEAREEFAEGRIYAEERAIIPSFMEKVFIPLLLPHLEKGASYEQAFRRMLDDKKINLWINNFRGETRNLPNALKLLTGKDFDLSPEAMTSAEFAGIKPKLEQFFLTGSHAMSPANARIQLAHTEKWIFGDEQATGYLKANREEETAYEFFGKPGVLIFDPALRSYIGTFEPEIRAPIVAALTSSETRAAFLNLGEGLRGDAYAREELYLARRLGYLRPGLVVVGGNAYGKKEFEELSAVDASLVWAPFSELLLYGDSLDVAQAKAAGLNLTLATGNGAAGAKNLLEQLKVARNYLDASPAREISNRDLVDMVTKNAARALRMEGQLGVVKPGAFANLTFLQCSAAKNPYD